MAWGLGETVRHNSSCAMAWGLGGKLYRHNWSCAMAWGLGPWGKLYRHNWSCAMAWGLGGNCTDTTGVMCGTTLIQAIKLACQGNNIKTEEKFVPRGGIWTGRPLLNSLLIRPHIPGRK
ncbi:hypothetical protein WDU94_000156 [Cyamophila willieti]